MDTRAILMSTTKQTLTYCSIAAVIGLLTAVYPNEFRTSKEGLELIANYEGCVSNTYKDTIGKCTVGIGSTRGFDGKPLVGHEKMTTDEVARLFMRDVKEAEQCVFDNFNGDKMPQPVLDSVVSLVYNTGCYGARWNQKAKRPTQIALFAAVGDWNMVCYHIADFRFAGGTVSKGLENRRKKEQARCLQYRFSNVP